MGSQADSHSGGLACGLRVRIFNKSLRGVCAAALRTVLWKPLPCISDGLFLPLSAPSASFTASLINQCSLLDLHQLLQCF